LLAAESFRPFDGQKINRIALATITAVIWDIHPANHYQICCWLDASMAGGPLGLGVVRPILLSGSALASGFVRPLVARAFATECWLHPVGASVVFALAIISTVCFRLDHSRIQFPKE